MHQLDVLPFPIGTTYSQNGTAAATDGQELEGKEFWVEDLNYTSQPFSARAYDNNNGAGKYKRVRIVRNISTITLQAARLVTFKFGNYGRQVDGYCTSTAQEAFPVDEFLPYNVPLNDLFYIVTSGFAGVYCALDAASAQGLSQAATTQVTVVALTAATSQATTAGRMAAQDLTGATALLGNQIQNRIGLALSARTTNQTNTIALVEVFAKW